MLRNKSLWGVAATAAAPLARRANSYFQNSDQQQGTAVLSNGNVVVSWQARTNAGATPQSADGDLDGAFFKVLSPTGVDVSGVVAPYLDLIPAGTGGQGTPRVAALSGGGFAITWQDDGADVFDGISETYVRVYDNNGDLVSSTVIVNELEPTGSADDQFPASIVGLTGGGSPSCGATTTHCTGILGTISCVRSMRRARRRVSACGWVVWHTICSCRMSRLAAV